MLRMSVYTLHISRGRAGVKSDVARRMTTRPTTLTTLPHSGLIFVYNPTFEFRSQSAAARFATTQVHVGDLLG